MRILLIIAFSCAPAFAKASLSGSLGNHSAWLFSDGKARHHRYELRLKHVAAISSRLSTVLEGRAWSDVALWEPPFGPHPDYPPAVRADERSQLEARQIYLDFLDDKFRLRAGLQQLDWVESISPVSNDLFAPRDLRFGALDEARQPQLAVPALDLNHGLLGGNLEWLVVALPPASRLPKGENGYGHYSGAPGAEVVEAPIPRRADETEGGLKYTHGIEDVDLSAFVFHGHQRMPALRLTPSLAPRIDISFPRVWTVGLSGSYARDAWVARGFTYWQPGRGPRFEVTTPGTQSHENLFRLGGGFDYVFSKHLKLYSELAMNRWELVRDTGAGPARSITNDLLFSLRLTNESLRKVVFSLDMTLSVPRSSFFLSPKATWNLYNYLRLTGGFLWIGSSSAESPLESVSDASQVYLTLEWFFSMG